MRIRTTSIGLPKTWERARLKHKLSSFYALSKPVSVLGEFMLSYLAFDHEQRCPSDTVDSCVQRTDPSLLRMPPYKPPAEKRPM